MSTPPQAAQEDKGTMSGFNSILQQFKLAGGRRRRGHRKSKNTRSRARKQRGGFIPGLGGIVQQALVPFGLYALQHSMKKRKSSSSSSSGRSITPATFRRFSRRRRS
jgi:hypothetical protein